MKHCALQTNSCVLPSSQLGLRSCFVSVRATPIWRVRRVRRWHLQHHRARLLRIHLPLPGLAARPGRQARGTRPPREARASSALLASSVRTTLARRCLAITTASLEVGNGWYVSLARAIASSRGSFARPAASSCGSLARPAASSCRRVVSQWLKLGACGDQSGDQRWDR